MQLLARPVRNLPPAPGSNVQLSPSVNVIWTNFNVRKCASSIGHHSGFDALPLEYGLWTAFWPPFLGNRSSRSASKLLLDSASRGSHGMTAGLVLLRLMSLLILIFYFQIQLVAMWLLETSWKQLKMVFFYFFCFLVFFLLFAQIYTCNTMRNWPTFKKKNYICKTWKAIIKEKPWNQAW